MKDYKISDEKDISRKCSILFLMICALSYLSYKLETFFIFKVILILFIAYLPLKGIIFLAKKFIQKISQYLNK